MKYLLLCLAFTTLVLFAWAHHMELCNKTEEELTTELACIRTEATQAFNDRWDEVTAELGCSDSVCTIKEFCDNNTGNLDDVLINYFTADEIKVLHDAATECDPDEHENGHDRRR